MLGILGGFRSQLILDYHMPPDKLRVLVDHVDELVSFLQKRAIEVEESSSA